MKKTLVFALTTLLIALSCGKAEKGSKSSEEKPAAPPADVVTVDLGLSVLWADRNIGAQNVEDFGDAFAWGEAVPREAGSFASNYVFNNTDAPEVLTGEYDTATKLWGEGWRMPTKQEMRDLFKLEHENVTENGEVVGVWFKGKGNKVYVPYNPTGEFYIWTSERAATLVTFAYYGGNYSIANGRREYAHYVRPVKSK